MVMHNLDDLNCNCNKLQDEFNIHYLYSYLSLYIVEFKYLT